MTAHALMVAVTGLIFVASGLVLLAVARLLGRTFYNKPSAPWWGRGLVFGAALGLVWRGVTFLFPGELVSVETMSAVVPLEAVIVLGLCLFTLDWVLRERDPPPLVERVLRLFARRGASDGEIIQATLALPVTPYAAGRPVNRCGRRMRLTVLIAAGMLLAGVAIVMLSAAAPLG